MRRALLYTALAVTASKLGAASPASVGGEDERFTLGEVTVTAQRETEPPGALTVIDRATLERFDSRRLSDALGKVPGLTLTPGGRGSPRAEERIYLRGFDGLQVPLLVDGVPFYSSWDGEPTDLARFTTLDLAAVEVSKGYTSLLYGPGTLGGAINLVSRRPTEPFSANFALSTDASRGGDYEGYSARANVAGLAGNFYYQLSGSLLARDAWTLPADFSPAGAPQANPMAPVGNLENGGERDRSSARDPHVSARLGYVPDSSTELALTIYDQSARKQVPIYAGPPDPNQRVNYFDWPSWDKRGVYLIGRQDVGSTTTVKVRLYYDEFGNSLDAYDTVAFATITPPMGFRSRYDDHAFGGSIEGSWRATDRQELVAALHYRQDDHRDISDVPVRAPSALSFSDRTSAVALEWRLQASPDWRLTVGTSFEARDAREAQDQNQAGASFMLENQDAVNAQAGVVRRIDAGEFYGSIGRKSRFPSQFERYSYRLGQALPNPGLDLERATNYELGFRGEPIEQLEVDAALFQSDLDDLIQPVTLNEPCTPTASVPLCTRNQNVGAARYRGAEASWRYPLTGALMIGGAYTWLDRDSRSTPRVVLFGTPEHAGFLYARVTLPGAVEVVPSATFASGRRTSDIAAADGEPVGGYATFDLRLLWSLAARYRLELTARNIGDRLYALDYGYPNAGRSYGVTLRANF